MITKRFTNEDAQAAVIFLFVAGTVLLLAIFIYMGPIIDGFTTFHVGITQGPNAFLPVEQGMEDSTFLTQMAIRDWPIFALLFLTLAAYVAALKQRSSMT